MVYILKLGRVYRATYISVWRPRGSNYSGKKTLKYYITDLSNWVYNVVLDASNINRVE